MQVDSGEEVSELLSLQNQIDLVIPRGGTSMKRSILEQVQGKIPILCHPDGICHVYLDKDADLNKALNVGELNCRPSFVHIFLLSCILREQYSKYMLICKQTWNKQYIGHGGTLSLLQWWTPNVITLPRAMP